MFNIREIQENVIYEAIKAESNESIAGEVLYGREGAAQTETNPDWVRSAMQRLESKFDYHTVKKIRMNCQCSYGMD